MSTSAGARLGANTVCATYPSKRWLVFTLSCLLTNAACRDHEPVPSVAANAPAASSAPPAVSSAPERSIAPLVTSAGLELMPPSAKSEPDPHWADDPTARVELDETFLLELSMGDHFDGYNVTTIAASGRASHVYGESSYHKEVIRRSRHRVEFEVEPGELNALVRLLNEQRFLQLPVSYHAPGVDDGARWMIHVRTRAREKYVSLANVFPEQLVRIARFVGEELIDKRPGLREGSALFRGRQDDHMGRWMDWYQGCTQDRNPVIDDDACMPLGVSVLILSDVGLDPGARYEVALVDRSDHDRVLTRSSGRLGSGDLFVTEASTFLQVRYDRVDVRHHYEVTARVVAADRAWSARPKPVMSYGEPYVVELTLQREEDGG